jgi:nicotinamidase/pyrazinamidase
MPHASAIYELRHGDALLVVDVQRDFLAHGSLAVPRGDEVVPVLNRYLQLFAVAQLPVLATRDWHPVNHCSFRQQGGPWPPHCVAGTVGATCSPALQLPADATIIYKATQAERDAYSGFEGTDLQVQLQQRGVTRLLIGGLATDYCIIHTVQDALKHGYTTLLLQDAIRPIDAKAGATAIAAMQAQGATLCTLNRLRLQTRRPHTV